MVKQLDQRFRIIRSGPLPSTDRTRQIGRVAFRVQGVGPNCERRSSWKCQRENTAYRHDNWPPVASYQILRWRWTLSHAALIIERNHHPTKTNCYIHAVMDFIQINVALPDAGWRPRVLPDTVREGVLFMSSGQKAVHAGLPGWPRLPGGRSALHRGLPVIPARPLAHLAAETIADIQ